MLIASLLPNHMYKTVNNVTILILITSNEVKFFYKEEKYFVFPCKNSLLACFNVSQFFDHVEEAVWAVEVLKTSGKTVGATLCISPHGDMNGVPPGECAVRLVKAGTQTFCDVVHHVGKTVTIFQLKNLIMFCVLICRS